MHLISLSFEDPTESGLHISEIRFNKSMNLFVGASGSGKTRVLNVIFNTARTALGETSFAPGKVVWKFSVDEKIFIWECEILKKKHSINGETQYETRKERLIQIDNSSSEIELFWRTEDASRFNENDAPKLPRSASGISIYRDEDSISSVFSSFKKIMRRNFAGDDLTQGTAYQSFPYTAMKKLSENKRRKITDIFGFTLSLHSKLYIIEKFFPSVLRTICDQFKQVFPDFEKITITSSHQVSANIGFDAPVVLVHERNVPKGTSLSEISSGMQKVLMIITDVLCIPKGGVYMIDEYENSLGANAIDFLPLFINEFGRDVQFIITTHHPVLINEIPIKHWHAFQRVGTKIQTFPGPLLEEKYGRSKQQQFIQLMNDKRFTK